MITALKGFDERTAAGILARAAIALEHDSNPAAAPLLPTEPTLRQDIFAEVRSRYGIGQGEITSEIRSLIIDALDRESDRLLGPVNSADALERLATKGDLPTDLYAVSIIGNVQLCYGERFEFEKGLIEDAIKHPDCAQHFGPVGANPAAPALVSLFAKAVFDKYPARSFIVLVAAQRQHLSLHVQQAWRVYPEAVDIRNVDSPLEMLRRFANTFGSPVTFGGSTGSFILLAELPPGSKPPEQIYWERKNKHKITVSYFWQREEPMGVQRASLIVAIDLDNYQASLEHFGWGRESLQQRTIVPSEPHRFLDIGTPSFGAGATLISGTSPTDWTSLTDGASRKDE